MELGSRRMHRSGSPGAGHLHADQGLPPLLPCVRRETETCVRGKLMSDQSFLAWPFFDDGHRDLVAELERWAADVLPSLLADAGESEADAAYACVKRLVPALG